MLSGAPLRARDACWVCGRARKGGGQRTSQRGCAAAPPSPEPRPGSVSSRDVATRSPLPLPAAGPHLASWGAGCMDVKLCPQGPPPKTVRLSGREKGLPLGRRTRRGAERWAVPGGAHQAGGHLLRRWRLPARLLAGFALRLQHPPLPHRGHQGSCPRPAARDTPPLRPAAPAAPSRVPLPPFSLFAPSSPPPLVCSAVPAWGRIPGVGSSPGEWKIGEAERAYRDAACALPQRPRQRQTSVPLQLPQPTASSRGPCLLAQEGLDTPEFAPLLSAGTGRVGGRGRAEGSGSALGSRSVGRRCGCGPGGPASRGPTSGVTGGGRAALRDRRARVLEASAARLLLLAALGALTAAPRDGCGLLARPRPAPSRRAGWPRARPSPSRQLVCRAGRGTGRAAAGPEGAGAEGLGLGVTSPLTAAPWWGGGARQRGRDAPLPLL